MLTTGCVATDDPCVTAGYEQLQAMGRFSSVSVGSRASTLVISIPRPAWSVGETVRGSPVDWDGTRDLDLH